MKFDDNVDKHLRLKTAIEYSFDAIKPNYFKKVCSSSSFLLTRGKNTGPKRPWSTQKASSINVTPNKPIRCFRYKTSLLSTPFWTCIFTSGK